MGTLIAHFKYKKKVLLTSLIGAMSSNRTRSLSVYNEACVPNSSWVVSLGYEIPSMVDLTVDACSDSLVEMAL